MHNIARLALLLGLVNIACSDDTNNQDIDSGSVDAPNAVDAGEPPAGPPCPLSNPDDPLCTINNAFRTAYANTRAETLANVDPVIVSIFDRVILLRAGNREVVNTIGDRYQELKSIAHVPLGLYVILVNHTGQALDDSVDSELTAYRALIDDARDSLGTRGFSVEQLARQERLLDGAGAFIDQVQADGQVSTMALQMYTASTAADIVVNAREAAVDQLEAMHAAVTGWLADMTPDERDRLHVLVANAHMPRVGSLTNQYFTALVDDPYEGKFDDENVTATSRMIAAEGVYDEAGLLNLLGTHIVDSDIGVSFFADPVRMHRDLLADVTEEWIVAEFGITPTP